MTTTPLVEETCVPGEQLDYNYNGDISISESGSECINWNDAPETYPKPIETDHNKCRSTYGTFPAWCWISDNSWENCRCPDDCQDSNENCSYWASVGECDANPGYMLVNCKMSCDQCSTDGRFFIFKIYYI